MTEETIPQTPQTVEREPQQEKMIEKITLPKKEKHPGRVAAGKRLAEFNRRKKLEKLQAQSEAEVSESAPPSPSTFDKCYLFLGVVGVALTAMGLYYARRSMHVCPLTRPAQPTQPAQSSKKIEVKEKPVQKAVYEME